MWQIPRLAIGTVQPQARCEPLLWGLYTALSQAGLNVQAFASQACFPLHDAARKATSGPRRFLDSWVMDEADCLAALFRGSSDAGLAVVDGSYMPAGNGGSLNQLCEWLALPRIAVVDLASLDSCRIPPKPANLEGILLDRAISDEHALAWQTTLEAHWNVPVLGWLPESGCVQALVDYLPACQSPSTDLCLELSRTLRRHLRLGGLLRIASRAPAFAPPEVELKVADSPWRKVVVAVAMDEAFTSYFPETLEELEAAGVTVQDFSPLRGESIPVGADVVVLGGSCVGRMWPNLAANHCLAQSLRCFAAAGGRVYAEGSGLAYLCRQVILADGRCETMSGLLPATARQLERTPRYEPVELTFGAGSWLFDARASVRGYVDAAWQIEPAGPMLTYAAGSAHRCDMLGRGNILGSRVLVHFAAHPHLLKRLGAPSAPRQRGGVMLEPKR